MIGEIENVKLSKGINESFGPGKYQFPGPIFFVRIVGGREAKKEGASNAWLLLLE